MFTKITGIGKFPGNKIVLQHRSTNEIVASSVVEFDCSYELDVSSVNKLSELTLKEINEKATSTDKQCVAQYELV